MDEEAKRLDRDEKEMTQQFDNRKEGEKTNESSKRKKSEPVVIRSDGKSSITMTVE